MPESKGTAAVAKAGRVTGIGGGDMRVDESRASSGEARVRLA